MRCYSQRIVSKLSVYVLYTYVYMHTLYIYTYVYIHTCKYTYIIYIYFHIYAEGVAAKVLCQRYLCVCV